MWTLPMKVWNKKELQTLNLVVGSAWYTLTLEPWTSYISISPTDNDIQFRWNWWDLITLKKDEMYYEDNLIFDIEQQLYLEAWTDTQVRVIIWKSNHN